MRLLDVGGVLVVQPAGHLQVVSGGQPREDASVAGHHGDAQLHDAVGVERGDRLPVEEHLAAGRNDEAAQRLDQGGLAGAIGPEHGHHLAVVDVEVDAEEHPDVVVAGLEPPGHEQLAVTLDAVAADLDVRLDRRVEPLDVLGQVPARATQDAGSHEQQRGEQPEAGPVAEVDADRGGERGPDGADRSDEEHPDGEPQELSAYPSVISGSAGPPTGPRRRRPRPRPRRR